MNNIVLSLKCALDIITTTEVKFMMTAGYVPVDYCRNLDITKEVNT
jgi:hypothetical protein